MEIAGGFLGCAVLGGLARLFGGSGIAATPALTLTALLLSTLVAYSLHRGLFHLTANRASRLYRIAVGIAFVGSLGALLVANTPPAGIGIELVLATGWGAFLGGLAASARDEGLWEDNYPPSQAILRQVLEAHRSGLRSVARIPRGKRWADVAGSAFALLLASPLAACVCLLLWLEDPGPLFFVKNSVGRGGRNFRQWKIRTMVRGAEAESGPVWAEKEDQRVLRIGVILRKTALDELPQLVNILAGQMSLVGPRPQRTVLVAEYLGRWPEYAERHRLPPGLAGLAQVVGHYYLTPRQKLRFDRLYIKHAGVGFDLKLILIAFAVVFWLRWQPGWNGRLPRSWLHRRS